MITYIEYDEKPDAKDLAMTISRPDQGCFYNSALRRHEVFASMGGKRRIFATISCSDPTTAEEQVECWAMYASKCLGWSGDKRDPIF